jgi:hypothetical protein
MSDTTKASLFDLFKELETYTVTDERGHSTTLAFRTLDYLEQLDVMEGLAGARQEARKRYDSEDSRAVLADEVDALGLDAVRDQLIAIERPTAEANVDLAPEVEDAETATEIKDAKAVEAVKHAKVLAKWEASRREDLGGMEESVLRKMLVERQVRTLIAIYVNTRFTEASLALMVVDPETQAPMLSTEKFLPDGTTPNPRHIGRLSPKTRGKLVDLWTEFTTKRNEKALRETADRASFLASGELPNGATAIPGATTETPATSQAP